MSKRQQIPRVNAVAEPGRRTSPSPARHPIAGPRSVAAPESLGSLSAQPLTARLAAAGSRRSEFEALFHVASPETAPTELRELIVDANVAGKGSAASRAKVWAQLRQRYVLDPRVPEYRAFAQAYGASGSPGDRGLVLYLMLARTDRTFRELVLRRVAAHLAHPATPISAADVQAELRHLVSKRRPAWTEQTLVTVSQHALSALKDFGVLQGGTKKKTARIHVGPPATLFAARLGLLEGLPARRIPDSVWFQLLGLDAEGAWHALQSAAADGVLRCRRQADVVELELPALPLAPDAAV